MDTFYHLGSAQRSNFYLHRRARRNIAEWREKSR
nr:MAG TPA: hypothetical protein [Caudoviricetes sp.]